MIALGEHQPDVEVLLVQRLSHGRHLARADLRIGKRQGYLDKLGQSPSAPAREVDLAAASSSVVLHVGAAPE
jgi:hypothetical protein